MKLSDFYGKYYNIYNEACKLRSFEIGHDVRLEFETENGDTIILTPAPLNNAVVIRSGHGITSSIGHDTMEINRIVTDIKVVDLNDEVEHLKFYVFKRNESLPAVVRCEIETMDSEIIVELI